MSSKTAMEIAVERGLQDKAAKAVKAVGPVPKIFRPTMDLEALKGAREKTVSETRAYLAQIGDVIADWVKFVRQLCAMQADERSAYQGELKHAENVILSYLGINPGDDAAQDVKANYEQVRKNPFLVGAAKMHYALVMADTCPPRKQAVFDLVSGNKYHRLPGLVQLDLLREVTGEAPKGATTIKVGDAVYRVLGKKDDAAKIAAAIEAVWERAKEAGREFYSNLLVKLRAEATKDYAVSDLLAGKAGRLVLLVPDSTRIVKDKESGKEKEIPLPGGTVLVESDGKTVKFIRCIGHFQRIVTEIADAGRLLQVYTLSEDKLNLGQRVDQETFRHLTIMHSILRRGIVAGLERMEFHKQCDADAEARSRKASVSTKASLLDSAHGTAVIELSSWTVEDREKNTLTKYPRVIFLFERNTEGLVRVVEYPDRLKPLFGDKFAEFMDPKERFEGLKYPLGAIMRKAWAIAKAAEDKTDQDAQRVAVETAKAGETPRAAHGWSEEAVRQQFGDAPADEK